ncbi:unnamed protein product, partial [marine sediment metagenome]
TGGPELLDAEVIRETTEVMSHAQKEKEDQGQEEEKD